MKIEFGTVLASTGPDLKFMRIGFVSTRFAGTDGVSLESLKWADVLEEMGHEVFWFSGRSDRSEETAMCVPEAFFGHPECEWIAERVWGETKRDPVVTDRIREMASYLEKMLYCFVEKFSIDIIVPENVLTIPVHVPLGIAITEFLAETAMPALAHHHDFYWERVRFSVNAVPDYLDMSFPPRLPNLAHSVINQAAQEQLALRKGLSSTLVPNVFNFEVPPPALDDYSSDFRKEIGLEEDDIFILQPTRIVPRKGIEHFEYRNMLVRMAEDEGVDLRIVADRIGERRQLDADGRKIYTLWDIYPHADLVTYPSLYEGFGNALLEAFYFRKPVVINRYSIFIQDIEPKGFQLVAMDGYVDQETVEATRRILNTPELAEEMVETNYQLATQFYGYGALHRALAAALLPFEGMKS